MNQRGFTLLELLIAMAIFAIMAVMAYGGLKTVLATRQAVTERAAELRQLQQTLQLLNEDLLQALPRSIRDELGDPEPAFIGGRSQLLLSLTRSMAQNWGKQLWRYRVQVFLEGEPAAYAELVTHIAAVS